MARHSPIIEAEVILETNSSGNNRGYLRFTELLLLAEKRRQGRQREEDKETKDKPSVEKTATDQYKRQ